MTPVFNPISLPAVRFMLASTIDSLASNPVTSSADRETQHQAATEALTALKPRDAAEAQVAARAVVTHHAAMTCFRMAAEPNLPNNVAMRYLGRALSLSRLATQLEAALTRRKSMDATRSGTHPVIPAPEPARAAAPATTRPEPKAKIPSPQPSPSMPPRIAPIVAPASAVKHPVPPLAPPSTTRDWLLGSTAAPSAAQAAA